MHSVSSTPCSASLDGFCSLLFIIKRQSEEGRKNQDGNDSMATYLASYLVENEIPLGEIKHDGDGNIKHGHCRRDQLAVEYGTA